MSNIVKTYKDAGVDIKKGDRFSDFIKNIKSDALLKGIGGFAGGIELPVSEYKSPVLLSCTDGVGTKLLVAKKLNNYSTVGIDLVAMSVNDLLVCGAKPLIFLDYIACGKISEKRLQEVITGIVKGCELAHTGLAGGETAEMPDMYGPDDIDLAGFAVGIGEKENILPKKDYISEGDAILGLPSSGIHSNGRWSRGKRKEYGRNSLSQQEFMPMKWNSCLKPVGCWQQPILPAGEYTKTLRGLFPSTWNQNFFITGIYPGFFHISAKKEVYLVRRCIMYLIWALEWHWW